MRIYIYIYIYIYSFFYLSIFFIFAKKCKTRKSRFRLNFCLILHQWGADVMKLDILAAFNTNSRRLIRILRSWGLVGAKKRKQGAAGWGWGWGKYVKIWKSGKSWKMGWEWSGEVWGRSRPVQNDQRSCRKVFKRVLAKDSLKKQWKTWFFILFPLFGVSGWGHS